MKTRTKRVQVGQSRANKKGDEKRVERHTESVWPAEEDEEDGELDEDEDDAEGGDRREGAA